MPFALKVRYSLFFALLLLLVIIYVTTGPASTRNSAFYQKTVALMDYRAGRGPAPDDSGKIPERPIHRAGGLHFAEGDHHLTPAERAAMEHGKLKGEPPVGPDGQPIGLDGEQIRGEEVIGPVDQSNQRGQRPLIDTDVKLRERLNQAEREAKKSADEKYRALKDIEAEVRKERELRGGDVDAPVGGRWDEEKGKEGVKGAKKEEDHVDEEEEDERPRKKTSDTDGKAEKTVVGREKVPSEPLPAELAEKDSASKSKEKEAVLANEIDEADEAPSPTATSAAKKKSKEEKQKQKDEDEHTHRLRTLLAEILAKSPVTIFSKTYCPFSMKAKRILLDAYSIKPLPYVVELNEHPEGQGLQQLLQKTTGRKTVPNVLVNGKSIGGGDETELLWKNGELPARIQQMSGKRVESVSMRYAYGQEPTGEEGQKPVGGGGLKG